MEKVHFVKSLPLLTSGPDSRRSVFTFYCVLSTNFCWDNSTSVSERRQKNSRTGRLGKYPTIDYRNEMPETLHFISLAMFNQLLFILLMPVILCDNGNMPTTLVDDSHGWRWCYVVDREGKIRWNVVSPSCK